MKKGLQKPVDLTFVFFKKTALKSQKGNIDELK